MNELLEARLRCLEAAAKNPTPHPQGYTAGVLEAAQKFEAWVCSSRPAGKVGLPGTVVKVEGPDVLAVQARLHEIL